MNEDSWEQLDNLDQSEIAILSDFDGTITTTETLGFIFKEFAESRFEFVRQWARGEIDMRDEIRLTFNTIKSSKKEMEQVLDKVEIAPGFHDFLEFSRKEGYNFAIVSDGLEWYIKYILDRYHIYDIPVFANRIFFESNGFRFEFPWFDEETHRRGVCKPKIARFFKQHAKTLVFIGDGRSDIDIVHEADIVYSRGWLAGYCYAKGLGKDEFYDWYDLKDKWVEQILNI
jgi:2,3-diketo-5-methylthio-1-phosphopentane phosphatase